MHVSEVRGIGPKKADLLKSMGIVTLGDMLAHYPYAYEDRSRVTPIAEASEGAACYIRAVVLKISKIISLMEEINRRWRLTAADRIPERWKSSFFRRPITSAVFRRTRVITFTAE